MKAKRLPKGHRVIYITPKSEERYLKKNKLSFKKNSEGELEVEGFIAGDKPGTGISLVALDNPEFCLSTIRDYDKSATAADRYIVNLARKRMREGRYSWVEIESIETCGDSDPICPYK